MSDYSLAQHFGVNLAELLSGKIKAVYPKFDEQKYIKNIASKVNDLAYSGRIELHARELNSALNLNYKDQIEILTSILGEENPNETGMFKNYYWVLPIGKFVEIYGINDFETSINAIAEITKRNTGEYAIRVFIRKYPNEMLEVMRNWAKSGNFHLRRLASEGLRPKLPWASKLENFIDDPKPVFEILELLKEDNVKFVQRSVANHMNDYLKLNFEAAKELLSKWTKSKNQNTQWIVKHATRKIKI
ncbi:DNA alkylation repair protein [Campylobacter sp. RM16187]|uniref:DNA alkylation repair protein n=1 Tax=Campylobacter sp. RM16187 TaxID=1660063 RepID=UPI0021B56F71|nr:DNA alkylation repair protein [Campylobacter sp. RM16187]QKG28986.1 3-methylpurine-DNA glycosylase [Campylobacter sp. RM16187]